MHTKRLLAVLCFACVSPAFAQTPDDDVDKPMSPTCGQPTESTGPTKAPPPQQDQPIDFTNPLLGFYPPEPGSVPPDKEVLESCADGEPYTPVDEGTDKSDLGNGAGPPPPVCASPDLLIVQAGIHDNYFYDVRNPEPAEVTQHIRDTAGNPRNWWPYFDQFRSDLWFGHHFGMKFQINSGYKYGLLTLHLKKLSSLQSNDTISLWSTGAPRGWGGAINDLGYDFVLGQDTTMLVDLRSAPTGGSNLLNDINTYGDLNVLIQDDTSVDDMTLRLSCDDPHAFAPTVGVVMGGSNGCGALPEYDVFLDNEDNKNANSHSGWIGATVSNKNTLFRLCGVDGQQFSQAASAGANFAVVSLAPGCPDGFTRFDRFHDNEDNRPASSDTAPNGSATFTTSKMKDTNFAFCVATNTTPGVPNSVFPDLGFPYGVFAGRTVSLSRWATDRGSVHLDDEDGNNKNAPVNPPSYTYEFLEPGKNTTYYIARVK
jgi:hypothetical protein